MRSAVGSTRIGEEGVPVTDGDNILPADSPEDFAARTVGLMTDSARLERTGRAAGSLVENRYGWPEVIHVLQTVFAETKTRSTQVGSVHARTLNTFSSLRGDLKVRVSLKP